MVRLWLAAIMTVASWVAPMTAPGDSTPTQFLGNPGFEAFDPRQPNRPDQWPAFCRESGREQIELTGEVAHGGTHSLRIEGREIKDSFEGVFQAHAASPGRRYQFAVEVRGDSSKPIKGSVRGQIAIEWMDSDGKEIGRVWGPDWGGDTPTDSWKHYDMNAKAPDGTAAAHFVVVLHEGPHPEGSAFFVDDAFAAETP